MDGNPVQRPGRSLHRFGIHRSGVFHGNDKPVGPGTLGTAGDGAEVTYVGHAVEHHNQRRFVVGHPVEDILQRYITDGGYLRHHPLVVAARHPVEFLHRHLLPAHPVPPTEVLELGHELSPGILFYVQPLYLPA